MSITTIIFLAMYFIGLGYTFSNPFFGIPLYIFEWHNHPPYWWWGSKLPDLRWSFTISIATLVSMFFNTKKVPFSKNIKFGPIIWLVLYIINAYFVSFSHAIDPASSIKYSGMLVKFTINYALMIYLIRNPKQFKIVIFVWLLGVANFGRIAWESGSNRDLGIIAPGATGGNLIAAHMMSTLPYFGVFFLLGKRWEKIFAAVSLPFVVNALILENSRSTILAVASMALLSPFFVKGKTRLRLVVAIIMGAGMFLYLTNESFWERQSTIVESEKEDVSSGRVYLWQGALRFLKDYPMGGGGEGFDAVSIFYVPELREVMEKMGNKTVHNTFLNILTEWGYIGFAIYMSFVIHTILTLFRVKMDSKYSPNYPFYNLYSSAMIISIVGVYVAGFFQNRQYGENIFWIFAFSVALRNMQVNEIKDFRENPEKFSDAEVAPQKPKNTLIQKFNFN